MVPWKGSSVSTDSTFCSRLKTLVRPWTASYQAQNTSNLSVTVLRNETLKDLQSREAQWFCWCISNITGITIPRYICTSKNWIYRVLHWYSEFPKGFRTSERRQFRFWICWCLTGLISFGAPKHKEEYLKYLVPHDVAVHFDRTLTTFRTREWPPPYPPLLTLSLETPKIVPLCPVGRQSVLPLTRKQDSVQP